MIETITDLLRQFRLYIHEILSFTLFLMEEETLICFLTKAEQKVKEEMNIFSICVYCVVKAT